MDSGIACPWCGSLSSFARKGEIRAREAPVPGLRQDVLGNHRDGIPLAEDARGQAEDGDKPHAQRHEAEGHNRLRGLSSKTTYLWRMKVFAACAVASNGARYAEVAGKGHITSAECVRTYGPT